MVQPFSGFNGSQLIVRQLAPEVQERRRSQFAFLQQHVGTGGTFQAQGAALVPSTSSGFIVTHNDHSCRAQRLPGMMQTIKEHLVPQVKDLAIILSVSRQTVYAWLQGSNLPTDQKFRRIEALHAVAVRAQRLLGGHDEKLVSKALVSSDLVDLLSRDVLPQADLDIQLKTLQMYVAAAHAGEQAEQQEDLDLFALAARMGKTMRPSASARAYIDAITGKGYGPEVDNG